MEPLTPGHRIGCRCCYCEKERDLLYRKQGQRLAQRPRGDHGKLLPISSISNEEVKSDIVDTTSNEVVELSFTPSPTLMKKLLIAARRPQPYACVRAGEIVPFDHTHPHVTR